MTSTRDIVQKLWNLCHVLRDDGITYQDYVTELTWLLFLKMARETGVEAQIPEGYRWGDLEERTGIELLNFYRELLLHLGTRTAGRVQQIFADASTSLRHPRNLRKLVQDIDALDWYSAREEGLGDLYEGLLEKNVSRLKGRRHASPPPSSSSAFAPPGPRSRSAGEPASRRRSKSACRWKARPSQSPRPGRPSPTATSATASTARSSAAGRSSATRRSAKRRRRCATPGSSTSSACVAAVPSTGRSTRPSTPA